jgi:hypothetical protein
LLAVVYPRAERGRLTYRQVLGDGRDLRALRAYLGLVVVVVAVASGMWLGNALSAGYAVVPWISAAEVGGTGAWAVGFGLLPVLALLLLGIVLL